MLRIAVCDDSLEFRTQINTLLNSWSTPSCTLVTEVFEDGDALLQAHTEAPFDIIFLDIIMPLLNGIETAREIREGNKQVKIVFLTSSPEFAVESYTVKANNYLLKPVNSQALHQCLNELIEELDGISRHITIKSSAAVHQVRVRDIEYLESQNKHVLVVLADGRTILSSDPLYSFETSLRLEDGFFKCSRSYIVNLHHISTYT